MESGLHWLGETFGSRPPGRRVRASPRGLAVETMAFLPRERITRAYFLPRGVNDAKVIVQYAYGLRRIAIDVLSRDEGMRLLRALRLDHRHATLEVRAKPRVRSFWILVFAAAWLATRIEGITGAIASGAPFFFVVTLGLLFFHFFAPRVLVGADGVTIRRGVLTRFFPYAEMRRAWLRSLPRRRRDRRFGSFEEPSSYDHWLVLETTTREEPFAFDMGGGERREEDLAGLVERIELAAATFRDDESSAMADAALARNDRPANEWAASLKSIAAGDRLVYRVAPVERETLFGVLEDPARTASARLAAAVALGASVDEAGRVRMKQAASGVAEPKLRVALEKVAAGSADEETAALLDEIDAREHERR